MVQGAFSFVSGKIAVSGPDSMVVTTPVATIGIRGTAAAGIAAPEGELNTITLLSEEGGIVGEISVTNSTGTVVLNVANASVTVESFFTQPSEPIILSNQQVEQIFGTVLSTLPASPAGGGVDVGAVEPGQGGAGSQSDDDDGDDSGDDGDDGDDQTDGDDAVPDVDPAAGDAGADAGDATNPFDAGADAPQFRCAAGPGRSG